MELKNLPHRRVADPIAVETTLRAVEEMLEAEAFRRYGLRRGWEAAALYDAHKAVATSLQMLRETTLPGFKEVGPEVTV